MRILIVTGIFPPDIGGPAEYAKNIRDVWENQGHRVLVKVFNRGLRLPSGFRHLFFFLKLIIPVVKADFIFCPDTFSAAVPAVFASRLMGKKIILRTGGDFLWEWYVERTGDLVLLKNFYSTRMAKLSFKERIIYKLVKFALKNADSVIFSTEWQRDIFLSTYNVDRSKTFIVENYYGPKTKSYAPGKKIFVAGTRPLKWKNTERISRAFQKVKSANPEVIYNNVIYPRDKFLDTVSRSYAVIIASLGDISPNTILDAIRANRPFILTRETGLYEKLKDIALMVDPENIDDIAEKISMLCDPVIYETYRGKVARFTFTHTWEEIGNEIIDNFKSLL